MGNKDGATCDQFKYLRWNALECKRAASCSPFGLIVMHSNRVSSNPGLHCRETEFLGQRQSGRNGCEGSRTPLQRQNLAKQPPPIRGYSAGTGKSPLEGECVVADAVAIEPVSLSKFPC